MSAGIFAVTALLAVFQWWWPEIVAGHRSRRLIRILCVAGSIVILMVVRVRGDTGTFGPYSWAYNGSGAYAVGPISWSSSVSNGALTITYDATGSAQTPAIVVITPEGNSFSLTTSQNLGALVSGQTTVGTWEFYLSWGGNTSEHAKVTFDGSGTGGGGNNSAPYRILSFSIQNTSTTRRTAYVFVTEYPGVCYLPKAVAPGETATIEFEVLASDTNHYYVAFLDVSATVASGGLQFTGTTTSDGGQIVVISNATPDSASATPAQTANGGTAATTGATNSGGNVGGIVPRVIGGSGQTTTGDGNVATNSQLSSVGNSINATATENAAAIQRSITSGFGNVTSKLDELDAKRHSETQAGQVAANSDGAAQVAGMAAKFRAANDAASGSGAALGTGTLGRGVATLGGVDPMAGDNQYAIQAHTVDTGSNPILPASLDVNPFTSERLGAIMGTGTAQRFCAWIRNFIAWAVILRFVMYVLDVVLANTFRLGMITPMQLTPGARILLQSQVAGNSVGQVAAVGVWGAHVALWSTALLAAPSVIAGVITSASSLDVLVASGKAAGEAAKQSSGLADILSFSYLILPVTVLVTVFLNGIVVRFSSLTQYIIIQLGLKLSTA